MTNPRRALRLLLSAGLLAALARAETPAPENSSATLPSPAPAASLESSPAPSPALALIEGRVALPRATALPRHGQPYELVIEADLVRTNPPLAVVYLEGEFPPAPATASDASSAPPPARIVQRDLTFIPGLLPVRTGTRVEFPNEDATYHNVFSFSPAKRFDLGRYRADETPPAQLFDRPGLVTLRCDIHKHMRAAILVLDTPHFVVTDPEGNFQLPALPPGRYTLKAWLDSRTTLARPVEITPGQTLRVEFP